MRIIKTRKGEQIMVDDADFDDLSQFTWRVDKGYVYTTMVCDGVRRNVSLHRYLMGCVPGDGVEVDHRNTNPLDNQRRNLRVGTHQNNLRNRSRKANSTGLRGVYQKGNRFKATIGLDGRTKHLGYFDTAEEAHAAYRAAASKLFGEYAHDSVSTN